MSSNLARSALLVVVLVLVQNPGQSQATIYTVINTRDSGPGSLAQALWDAEGHAGFDSVYFNIPTSDSAYTPGPPSRWIIRPSASTLSLFDDVLIDGYTQPSAQPNTVASPGATDALLRIVLSGVNAGASANGLHLLGSSTVRGLVINSWSGAGIYLVGGPTVVEGNYIGTNANGVTAYGNAIGIDAPHGTHTIGGTTPAARNVISGNTTGGIQIGSAGLTAEITVQGNYIGTRASGTAALANGSGTGYGISIDYGQNHLIGGTTAAARNLISGNNGDGIVLSQRSTGTIISGNYIGTHADGIADLGNTRHGVYLMYKTSPGGSTDAVIGGPSSGAGNVISGNDGCGVFAYGINDVVIQGNYVGINAAGSGALANSQDGIGLLLSDATSVGGTGSGEGNTISGNSWSGIRLRNSEYTLIRGNRIGTDVAGTADVGNGGHGVYVNSNHTEIGGSSSGYWNTIAFNDSCGVGIFWAYFNGVMGNSIHSNGRLGIDLAKSGDPASGVTYNDYQDPDFDSNYLQNYPVITSAKSNAALTVIEGTLNSTPSTTFYLQFYSNPTPDPTNYGEGTTWLRDTMVTTDGNGDAAFSVTYSPPLTLGSYVCATATDPDANTSEFGANREVSKLTLTVVNTNDAGTGSLRQALLYANASAGPDTILFDIPTSDPGYVVGPPSYWSIQPDSALPVVSDTVIIDGYSQPGAQPNTIPAPGTSNAVLKIELDGSNAGGSSVGLEVSSGGCVFQGLVINRFGAQGVLIDVPGGAHIPGCYVGTDVTGLIDLGNGADGISLFSGANTVGGSSPADRNIISGNTNHGIVLRYAAASNNVIRGNYIGVDVTGASPLGNGNRGIRLYQNPSNNTIGGTGAGEANIIANSGNAGVGIHSATGNTIRGNSILDNAGLGIDLNDDGVSVNDSADVDTGPNNVQNYPVLSSAYPAGSTTRVQGALNSTPSTAFTLDFYASAAADPTGYGEGATWVGTAGVTTDVNGDVSFTTTISTAVAIGWYIAATATDPGGNTSEFSQCVMVTDPFVVINTSDSGPGSLREAITMANSIAGMDTITFDIPTSDPGYVAGPPAYWSIAPASNLPTINQGVMIDGYTQLGAQLNTVAAPDTSNAVLTVELRGNGGATGRGIQLNNVSNCVIRGLVINRFPGNGIFINGTGAGHLIEGNYIGTDITGTLDRGNTTTGIRIESGQSNNIIGGTTPGSRNVISGNNTDGIFLYASDDNVLQGNFIGTDMTGRVDRGNSDHGIYILDGEDNTIGGTTAAARNIISGNGNVEAGITLRNPSAKGNIIQGNYIGTDVTASVAIPQTFGIELYDAPDNTIGGATPGAGNVISGNLMQGIIISYASLRNVIQGNWIGTNESLATGIGNNLGIDFQNGNPCDNLVGGTAPGEGNIIWHNGYTGIRVWVGQRNTIIGNSIFGNADLGIELSTDGVTANDAGDSDTGPNGLQNYPVLTAIVSDGAKTVVQGTLNSTPDSTFALHFYYSTAADPTGYGEGQTFFADSSVTVDAMGDASFTFVFDSVTVPNGSYVAATATDPQGATSEFSQTVVSAHMSLTGVIAGSNEQLQWTTVPPASEYWLYGASNDAYFVPEIGSPYAYRVTVLPSGTTTWSTTTGVGDVNNNWTYLVIAVDGAGQELVRTNRIGEHDYTLP